MMILDLGLPDLGLPYMDGINVIKRGRTWSNIPIIVISARSEDRDNAGTDDYLTKPPATFWTVSGMSAELKYLSILHPYRNIGNETYVFIFNSWFLISPFL
jgi:two-component system KDP operon response regulator KdpE